MVEGHTEICYDGLPYRSWPTCRKFIKGQILALKQRILNLSVIDLMSYYHIGKTNKYLERGISIVLGEKQAERFRQSFDQPLRAERDREYKEKLKRQSIYQPKTVQTRTSMAV